MKDVFLSFVNNDIMMTNPAYARNIKANIKLESTIKNEMAKMQTPSMNKIRANADATTHIEAIKKIVAINKHKTMKE
ncbi:MAG: hypothetical protein K6C34_04770 [Alphaproteobacteria bacterium]|nr:hypothetical protein [Alphaproteobacteria bacterium]